MFCSKCGKQVVEGYRFCDGCGTPVQNATSAAPDEGASAAAAAAPAAAMPPVAMPPAPMPPIGMPARAPMPPTFAERPVVGAQEQKSGKAVWIVLAVLLFAVVGGLGLWKFGMSPKVSNVDVTIAPSGMTVASGGTVRIEASVTGAEDIGVTWQVQEGAAGGTITPAGASAHDGRVFSAATYTAPTNRGVYHVLAVSNADSKKAAGVTIRVR